MNFADTAPHHRMPEPTRAALAAADEAHAQQTAATWGARCHALADELAGELDRYPEQWSADDIGKLRDLHQALADALTMAKEIRQ